MLAALLTLLTVVQAPNPAAPSCLSCCCRAHSPCSFEPIPASLAQLSAGLSVRKWFFSRRCVKLTAKLCCCAAGWGQRGGSQPQPATRSSIFPPAAFLACEFPNVWSYRDHFIASYVHAQQYLLRISAQPGLEEATDSKPSFAGIMTQLNWVPGFNPGQNKRQTLALGLDSRGIAVLKQVFLKVF